MIDFLQKASEYRDFAWIIFTLVATVTSILSYLQVRKSVYQSLYNKITEEQITLCTELLELLKCSEGAFLISCDFENFLKFNMINHLIAKGVLTDIEDLAELYASYNNIVPEEIIDPEMYDILDKYETFTITINEDMDIPIEEKDGISSNRRTKHEKIFVAQKFTVEDNRGLLIYTPGLGEVDKNLQLSMSNIYMPKQLIKVSRKFYERFLELILKKAAAIMYREELRIYRGKKGDIIELNFPRLYNELMENNEKLVKSYGILKKEIRKLLKIDKM